MCGGGVCGGGVCGDGVCGGGVCGGGGVEVGVWRREASSSHSFVPTLRTPPSRNGLVNETEFLGLIPQNGGRPMRLRDH